MWNTLVTVHSFVMCFKSFVFIKGAVDGVLFELEHCHSLILKFIVSFITCAQCTCSACSTTFIWWLIMFFTVYFVWYRLVGVFCPVVWLLHLMDIECSERGEEEKKNHVMTTSTIWYRLRVISKMGEKLPLVYVYIAQTINKSYIL